jgi:hypothetical protein
MHRPTGRFCVGVGKRASSSSTCPLFARLGDLAVPPHLTAVPPAPPAAIDEPPRVFRRAQHDSRRPTLPPLSLQLQEHSPTLTAPQFGSRRRQAVLRRPPPCTPLRGPPAPSPAGLRTPAAPGGPAGVARALARAPPPLLRLPELATAPARV